MNNLIETDYSKITAKLSDNQLVTQQSPNWFEFEDLNEMNESQLNVILHNSFQQWLNEIVNIAPLDYSFALYNRELHIVAVSGKPEAHEDEHAALIEWKRLAKEALHSEKLAEGKQDIAVPVMSHANNRPIAVLICSLCSSKVDRLAMLLETASLHLRGIFYRLLEIDYLQKLYNQQRTNNKALIRQDQLIEAAKRLHDQIEASSVLNQLLMDLEQLYPHAEVGLYLSQDHVNDDLRVKPLLIRQESGNIYTKAFLNGSPIVEHISQNCTELAIPMSGKQAVYGVISMSMDREHWDDANMRSLIVLSDAAGSAFENAKLFEQSNLLVGELQLINELTKRLNQSLRLNEIFEFAMTELTHIFKADYCILLQLKKDTDHFQVMSSNLATAVNENFSTQYGFCGIVNQTKEPLIISDYWANRVVDSQIMDETKSRSLIAAPIMANTEVVGVIMVVHQNPNYFSYSNYKLLQVLTTHIGLAITNASLHAEVRRMVITDNLTGLHARHYLNEQISLRQRMDRCGSLVLVDIDHFKKINDTYGHQIGDRILIAVSNVIKASIRESDIAARWGGEELAVYLPQIQAEQAFRIAERIRSQVESQTDPTVTVSCGISEWMFEDEKVSVESLFYRADMALYEAKNNGRNRIFIG